MRAASEEATTIPDGMILGRDTEEFAASRHDFVLNAIHRFQDQAAEEQQRSQVCPPRRRAVCGEHSAGGSHSARREPI